MISDGIDRRAPRRPGAPRLRRAVAALVAASLAGVAALVVVGTTAGPSMPAAIGTPVHRAVPTPATKASGTLPPNNPPANIPANPNFLSNCSGAAFDNSQGCVKATLQAIDNARAQEGIAGMALPTNWFSLSPQQQLYVSTNLERTARGLAPLTGMATALDQASAQGAQQSQDPMPPSGFPWTTWGSNWAGAVGNPLEAIYYWMYDDGMNSGNIDCTPSNQSGCWGHRDNILLALGCSPCDMGTGYAPGGYQGYPSWAQLLVDTSGSPQLDYSWSQVTPYLTGGATGPLDPDLYEFTSDHASGRTWNAYDETTGANGPGILTTPSAVTVGSVVHVFTWAANGDLVEFVSDHANGHVWNAYDHTLDAGGGAQAGGPPDAVLDAGDNMVHVYVESSAGHLMEYIADHANGHVWNAYDHTLDAGGAGNVSGQPSALYDTNDSRVHVFVESDHGNLMEYIADHANGHVWNAYNHSLDAGGGTWTSGAPSAVLDTTDTLVHIFVESSTGHLMEYIADHANGHVWNAYDHSQDAGGGRWVNGTPSALFDTSDHLIHVFVQANSSNDLTEFLADHANGHVWNAYDHSLDAGGGSAINGMPDAIFDSGSSTIHVLVRSSANHIVEYLPDHAGGRVWNAYDHTVDAGGPTIGTDPSALDLSGVIHTYVGGE